MNLEKAIELNIESAKSLKKGKFHDHSGAVMLGNEALKRLRDRRNGFPIPPGMLLIGEEVNP